MIFPVKRTAVLFDLHTLNNEAVSSYKVGQNTFAYKTLVMALNKAHEQLQFQDAIGCNHHTTCCRTDNVGDESQQVTTNSFGVTHEYAVQPQAQSVLFQGIYRGSFVFRTGIFIDERETLAVMLYNLALIMHHAAIQSNRMSELQKVYQVYKRALRLVQHTRCDELQIMMAALCVNMAAILIKLNVQETMNATEQIITNLKTMITSIRTTKPHAITPRDMEFFVEEIYFCQLFLLSTRFAPAA
jgi:hypothetical protein